MQAPGPPELLPLPAAGAPDHASQGGKYKNRQARGSPNTCLGTGAGEEGPISVSAASLGLHPGPLGGEGEFAPASLRGALQSRSETHRKEDRCFLCPETDARSCWTIDSFVSLSHTSFVKRAVITLEESLEKSVQIEKDWKWAPLAAETTLSILNRSLPGRRLPLAGPSASLPPPGSRAHPGDGRVTCRAARSTKGQLSISSFDSYCFLLSSSC